jgi:hypothetical protein
MTAGLRKLSVLPASAIEDPHGDPAKPLFARRSSPKVTLLIDAFRRTLGLCGALGVHAMEVDAIDEQARAFYEKYGFVPPTGQPLVLYMPVTTIRNGLHPG